MRMVDQGMSLGQAIQDTRPRHRRDLMRAISIALLGLVAVCHT